MEKKPAQRVYGIKYEYKDVEYTRWFSTNAERFDYHDDLLHKVGVREWNIQHVGAV